MPSCGAGDADRYRAGYQFEGDWEQARDGRANSGANRTIGGDNRTIPDVDRVIPAVTGPFPMTIGSFAMMTTRFAVLTGAFSRAISPFLLQSLDS